jgi:ribosomal 50S subunit-recycling heat shock protein
LLGLIFPSRSLLSGLAQVSQSKREMRVDLFLKASRLCPRRTVAQKLCDAGLVFVNGHSAKSSHAVKPGDEVDLRRRNQLIKVRVLAVPATRQTSRKEAGDIYEILTEESLDQNQL